MPPRRNEPRRRPERLASSLESEAPLTEVMWPDEESDVDPSYDPSDDDDTETETESESENDSFIVTDEELHEEEDMTEESESDEDEI